eukprot:1138663-Pelagomonas_calceolata.AAC.4
MVTRGWPTEKGKASTSSSLFSDFVCGGKRISEIAVSILFMYSPLLISNRGYRSKESLQSND